MDTYKAQVHELPCPVPFMLDAAVGYLGNAGLIGFFVGSGNEACHSDGRVTACGAWYAYNAYGNHPLVAPHLSMFDFGSSDGPSVHWLLLDRDKRQLAVAPVVDAQRLLREQWPSSETDVVPEESEEDACSLLVQELMGWHLHLSRTLAEQWPDHRRSVQALMAWLAEQWEAVL